jgi:cyclopropane fatty-acyl-phospholipid synthase-like methyltransferase
MKIEKLEDFYQVYDEHRTYVEAKVRKKHISNFDEQFWIPAKVNASHSVLEIGTGSGIFLAYLEAKGIKNYFGIDSDKKVLELMPTNISSQVEICDVWDFLNSCDQMYDRIVLLDVFEHFSYIEGHSLLLKILKILSKDGKIILRVPNAASPFGLQYQYNDLTHKAVYGPGSIGHMALSAGCVVEHRLSVRRGNKFKRTLENILLKILDIALTEPPPLWGANMVVVISAAK